MRTSGKSVVFLVLLYLLVLVGGDAEAAKVVVTSGGGGVFYLQGIAMDGVAGMDITVTYDANSISNPTVVPGALISNQGALLSSNTANTGVIRLGVIKATSFTGDGLIATLTFTRNSKVALKIPVPTVTAIDQATNPVEIATESGTDESSGSTTETQSSSSTNNSSENSSDSSTTDTTTKTTASGTTPSTWLGNVNISSGTATDTDKKIEEKQSGVAAMDAQKESGASELHGTEDTQEQPSELKAEKEKAKEPKFLAYKGVLETLKAYTGPRQPKEILDLFGQQSKGYRQEPPVFLADGKGILKVRITPPHDAASAPNVAINKEAQLVSFRRGDENAWVVELRPKKGAYQVVLTYFIDDVITEIPLTVAPLLEAYNGKPFAKLNEADFRQFLARGGAPADQKVADLNGDGVVDAIDDYLFAANYLVQTAAVKPAAKEQKGNSAGAAAGEQKTQPAEKTR